MRQIATGKLTESRVRLKLESLGLVAHKPVPDRGIDLEVYSPDRPAVRVRLQVKGRNPKKDPNLRWFQVRVPRAALLRAQDKGIPPNQTWIDKVSKVDFFVLDAVKADEMWVLSRDQTLELIRLNEHVYQNRPDNVFTYSPPVKLKQKEMNLDIEVDGVKLTDRFRACLNNFDPILEFLDLSRQA